MSAPLLRCLRARSPLGGPAFHRLAPSARIPRLNVFRAPLITSSTLTTSSRTSLTSSPTPSTSTVITAPNDHITLSPPPYFPPQTGLLSKLPPSWIPYAELIRLDKPTGTYYLFLPCLWSTILAGTLTVPMAGIPTIVGYSALFATGALIMRGAGCTINDFWDREFDKQVRRTWHRPIARGAVSPTQAIVFLGGQLGAGFLLLCQFPISAILMAIPSLILVGSYPLMKRVTMYPQAVLGLAFSWGAVLGFPALGVELWESPAAAVSAAALVTANTAWTVMYDTIYAHMDVKDDRKAGVKSIVVKHEGHTRELMSALALVKAGGLSVAGWACGLGPVYWVWSVAGSLAGNLWKVWTVDLEDRESCWKAFQWIAWAVGGVAVGGGLFAEYIAQRLELGWYEKKEKAVEANL